MTTVADELLALVGVMLCLQCGQEHVTHYGYASCKGHQKGVSPLAPCRGSRLTGLDICRKHGATSAARAAGLRRREYADVEGQVAALMRECDMPEQHPIDGLLEVVRHTGGMMRLLGALVAELDIRPTYMVQHDEDTGERIGVISEPGLYGPDHQGDGKPHVLVVLYGVWAERYARACKLALDANIDERLVRNAESTTSAVYGAIEAALVTAQLAPDAVARFTTALGQQMRKLVGPAVVVDIPPIERNT